MFVRVTRLELTHNSSILVNPSFGLVPKLSVEGRNKSSDYQLEFRALLHIDECLNALCYNENLLGRRVNTEVDCLLRILPMLRSLWYNEISTISWRA
jgi:hypothetical protein